MPPEPQKKQQGTYGNKECRNMMELFGHIHLRNTKMKYVGKPQLNDIETCDAHSGMQNRGKPENANCRNTTANIIIKLNQEVADKELQQMNILEQIQEEYSLWRKRR